MKLCVLSPQYYSGEKVAPVLTIFVGGNHEASNYLQELPYGGWVAPNIYYLGYAGRIFYVLFLNVFLETDLKNYCSLKRSFSV